MGNMMLKNLGTGLVLGCPILQTVYSVINPLVNVYIYIYIAIAMKNHHV